MNNNTRMVVFDDDPTGIQTVHGCLLVTDWSDSNIRTAFEDGEPFFYVLTNTRAMTPEEAKKTLTDALETVIRVNKEFGYKLICVSRSDSCLRGHFPLEPNVMKEVLESHGIKVWPKIPFAPAFIESGRITIDGVHYMRQGERLIPVSETEFAHDNVFGYKNARLVDYVIEKGGNPADYEIVNASSYEELNSYRDEFFVRTKEWEGAIVIRSSSSLPRAFSSISNKPLLNRETLGITGQMPGCFVVGSHVQKTTNQLSVLLKESAVEGLELSVERILTDAKSLMSETIAKIADASSKGLTPVVYTSRKEVRLMDKDKRQHLGQTVSDFLVSIVRNLPYTPSYLVAKGGITSHDILTKGLGIKTARVMGQAINSVPCVMAEKFPYIIFPGNVGGEESLDELYKIYK